MNRSLRSLAALAILAALMPTAAMSHGGVSIESDLCILRLGPYMMHFTGYQPDKAIAQEFCEDIPYEGKAIIVLDEVDKKLREMPLEFRILKDVKNLGIYAKYEQLGTQREIQEATVVEYPFKVYTLGTFNFEMDFPKGNYIGLAAIEDKDAGQTHYSVFPFSVGYGPKWTYIHYLGAAFVLSLLGGLYLILRRGKARSRAAA